jgi:UDPglucose 6-dehydrogenase
VNGKVFVILQKFLISKKNGMNVAIVGTGYVGLVTGACFSEMGVNVTCVDIDAAKIEKLKQGIIPIYEPALDDLVKKNIEAGRLHFTTQLADCLGEIQVVFSAVGTPPDEDGSADLKYVLNVAREIGATMTKYVLVVTKSTVPVGTAKKVKQTIQAELNKRGVQIPFDVASNPEFLKEGTAVKDFMSPDRVVVGVESERARELMDRLYKPFLINNYRIIFTDIPSAEMIKYAANAMLATRISFINDIANLCEIVGADVNMVRRGIGSDTRIGTKFLYPGCGYGGSCFPKDVKALIKTAADNGYEMQVLKSVERVNENQKKILFEKLKRHFNNDLKGKTIAVWGLAFKPETDDMREAPSLVIIDLLLAAGCNVKTYDPISMDEGKRILGDKVLFCKDLYDAALDADAVLLLTEWKEFRLPSWNVLKRTMTRPLIIDGRNIYDKKELAENGFDYDCIGMR